MYSDFSVLLIYYLLPVSRGGRETPAPQEEEEAPRRGPRRRARAAGVNPRRMRGRCARQLVVDFPAPAGMLWGLRYGREVR